MNSLPYSREEILEDYRRAVTSRKADEQEARMSGSGQAKFCILAGGTELPAVVSGRLLQNGDWVRGYYRNLATELIIGVATLRQIFAQVIGDTEEGHEPQSGGRMMGRHHASRLLDTMGELIDLTEQVNRAADVSSTSSQMAVALGLARASRIFKEVPEIAAAFPGLSQKGQEIAMVSIGDSSMAEGLSYEAIAQAVIQEVPLLVSVLDNGYGISVPRDQQIPLDSISTALSGFDRTRLDGTGLHIIGPVEGWDYVATRQAYEEAFNYIRRTGKPALVHCLVTQPFGHSSSGDHKRYKSAERLEFEESHDPITRMRAWMIEVGIANEEELRGIEDAVSQTVKGAAEGAWQDYYVPICELARGVLNLFDQIQFDLPDMQEVIQAQRAPLNKKLESGSSPYLTRGEIYTAICSVLLASRSHIESRTRASLAELRAEIHGDMTDRYSSHVFADPEHSPAHVEYVAPHYKAGPDGKVPEDKMPNIIAAGLATLMAQDPRVVVFGEDAGKIGGVIAATRGLQGGREQAGSFWDQSPALKRYGKATGFGKERVWDHPIAEASILGTAIGLGVRGLRPIAEVQYEDYLIWALQQLIDEAACLRHRTDGGQEAPMLLRVHGNQLLGMWHSGSHKGMVLTSTPGLCVLVPRNAVQAIGLYRAVMQGRDPALAIESLMSHYGSAEAVPDNLDEICIPLGHSEVIREVEETDDLKKKANQMTIVTYGYNCNLALQAAENLAKEGIEVEVVDLQTLQPLDVNGVAVRSMIKTGKVLFLDEDITNGGGRLIAYELIKRRDANGVRAELSLDEHDTLSAANHKPPYGADGKFFCKPNLIDIEHKVRTMLDELDQGRNSRDGLPRAGW